MRHKLFLLGIILSLTLTAFAHSGKPRMYAIVDTDCAADDLRTLCMLLGDHDIEILAITTSEGALTPQQGYRKVKALLNDFYHQEFRSPQAGKYMLLLPNGGILPGQFRGETVCPPICPN